MVYNQFAQRRGIQKKNNQKWWGFFFFVLEKHLQNSTSMYPVDNVFCGKNVHSFNSLWPICKSSSAIWRVVFCFLFSFVTRNHVTHDSLSSIRNGMKDELIKESEKSS